MKRLTIAAVLILATSAGFASAQAPAPNDPHHPPQTAAPAPAQSTPTPGQTGMGGMPMIEMMRGMKDNMSMMNMMETMRSMRMMGSDGAGMGTIDRVEGRIAFLRAELKITDAQAAVWNAFADALRANAKKLGDMRASMMSPSGAGQPQAATIIERIESQERWMQARLEGVRTMKTSLAKLYENLSDDQKKSANELLAPHMGMMAMMRAQMGPGQMRPGQMGPDPH